MSQQYDISVSTSFESKTNEKTSFQSKDSEKFDFSTQQPDINLAAEIQKQVDAEKKEQFKVFLKMHNVKYTFIIDFDFFFDFIKNF